MANVPEYYSELSWDPQSLQTLAILLLGIRSAESGESREQNEEMVHRVKVSTIFEGITACGANALQIAKYPGVLENMVRVLELTEDNPVQLQLPILRSLHNIAEVQSHVLKIISIGTDAIEILELLIHSRDNEEIKYYASSILAAVLHESRWTIVRKKFRNRAGNFSQLIKSIKSRDRTLSTESYRVMWTSDAVRTFLF